MRRRVEIGLGLATFIISILGSVYFASWLLQDPQWRDHLHLRAEYRHPAFALVWAFWGLVGMLGAVSDGQGSGRPWGLLTWAGVGGIASLMPMSAFDVWQPLLAAAAPLSIAALSADRRRGRRPIAGVAMALAAVFIGFLVVAVAAAAVQTVFV